MYGKVGRCASEEVIVELLKLTCLPVLFYGLESCPINKSQTRLLDFAINSAFSKIFCMKSRGDIEVFGKKCTEKKATEKRPRLEKRSTKVEK